MTDTDHSDTETDHRDIFDTLFNELHDYRQHHFSADPTIFVGPEMKHDLLGHPTVYTTRSAAVTDTDMSFKGVPIKTDLYVDGCRVLPASIHDLPPDELFFATPPYEYLSQLIDRLDMVAEADFVWVTVPFELLEERVALNEDIDPYASDYSGVPPHNTHTYDAGEQVLRVPITATNDQHEYAKDLLIDAVNETIGRSIRKRITATKTVRWRSMTGREMERDTTITAGHYEYDLGRVCLSPVLGRDTRELRTPELHITATSWNEP